MPLTGTTTRCSRCGPGRTPSSRTWSSSAWASYWRKMNDMMRTRIGMRTRTSHAPAWNLTAVTTIATAPVRIAPNALIDRRRRQPGATLPQPVADHAGLADREVDEHADRVQRDEQVGDGPEADDQQGGDAAEDEDPVGVGEPVAAKGELARHVAVLGEDREQARERVEARVRGEEQEQGREGLEQVEHHAVAVDRAGDLRDDGLARELDVGDPEVDGQERDPDEQDREQGGHVAERRGGVLRLRWLERRDAGRDRLGAGQGHGAGREGSQQQDER